MKNFYKLSLALFGFVMVSGEPVFGSSQYPFGYTIKQTTTVTPNYLPVVPISERELTAGPRVQLFSILNTKNLEPAHIRFNELAAIYPDLRRFTAYALTEAGSGHVRGQIGGFITKDDADKYAAVLQQVFKADKPQPVAAGTAYQTGFKLEKAELHNWS